MSGVFLMLWMMFLFAVNLETMVGNVWGNYSAYTIIRSPLEKREDCVVGRVSVLFGGFND